MKKYKALTVILIFSGLLLLIVEGCSTLTSAVMGGTKRAISERIEQAVYKKLAPKDQLPPPKTANWNQFMILQAQIVFSYSFSAGGLWIGKTDYKPGEWTRFEWKAEDESPVTLERAFLKKLDSEKEWWRVSWSDEEDTWIYEALLSKEEGSLLRLRARDADGNEGEVPVTGEIVYIPPAEVTEESIKGATVGHENLKTPVGTFSTDHIVYMTATNEGKIEWWITDEVPGGVVKYLFTDDEGKEIWTCVLKEKGTNATTILGAF